MAHRAILRATRNVNYKISEICGKRELKQDFRNLLVLDFEASCDERFKNFTPQEIIEIPCVVLSTSDWKVKDVFHEYVKPQVNPQLTTFCTDLTGIIQEVVDTQPHFPVVFDQFNQWLKNGGYFDEDNKSAFLTSGDWDLGVMLPKQCELNGISVPKHFLQWIDLKKTICEVTNTYPRGLKSMAKLMCLSYTGKLHSGINDVHNIVKIITRLYENHKINFTINSSVDRMVKIDL